MTAKRRSFVKKYFTPPTKEADISWTSSSSETEEKPPNKRSKSEPLPFSDKARKWFDAELLRCFTKNSIEAQGNEVESDAELSPVLGVLRPEDASPVLVHKSESPVISRARKRIKPQQFSRTESSSSSELVVNTKGDSPDLFSTQSSCMVVEDPSPQSDKVDALTCQILTIPSQEGTEVHISTPSVTSSKSTSTSSGSLYHELQPKKKKYKKNGLAHQLQKALQLQKTKTGIWHHERYLSEAEENAEESVKLIVRESWMEFGSSMLLCDKLENIACSRNKCIVIVGHNSIVNASFETGKMFQLFPPYNTTRIKFKEEIIDCYYNIARVLMPT